MAPKVTGMMATWNHTPSLPLGLYLRTLGEPAVGRIVAFPAPAAALDYDRRRGGSGAPATFLKPLAAGPGDHVCTAGGHLTINGRPLAPILAEGAGGAPLPRWEGCRRLGAGEWFTFAPRVLGSFDGRYYGPISQRDIIGVYRPVWTD